MGILDYFRRGNQKTIKSRGTDDNVLAYYMHADGRIQAIKSTGYGGFSRLRNFDSRIGALSNDIEDLAVATTASVWVAACINKRAQSVANIPWRILRKGSDEDVTETHPFAIALQRAKPSVIQMWVQTRLAFGETFIEPMEASDGKYRDLRYLNNTGMYVDTTPGYIRRFQFSPPNGGEVTYFDPWEIFYSHTVNWFDDHRGQSPLESVLLEIGIDYQVARMIMTFYANDTRLGGIITPKEGVMNQADADRLTTQWQQRFGGSANAGKTAFLSQALEYTQLQQRLTVDDVQTRESVRREICAALGVPLSLAGAWDDANYQSLPEQRKSFYEETVIPDCEQLADEFTEDLLPFFDDSGKFKFEFVYDEIRALAEDDNARQQRATGMLMAGGITVNEYREMVGLPPIKTGDVFYVPSGNTQVPWQDIGKPLPQASPFPQLPRTADTVSTDDVKSIVKAAVSEVLAVYRTTDNLVLQDETLTQKVAEASKATPESYCYLFKFGAHDTMMQVKDTLQSLLPETAQFLSPDEYHMTAAYATRTGDTMPVLVHPQLNGFRADVVGIGTFDTPDGYAVHLRVKVSDALTVAQGACADALSGDGFALSPYSQPDAYNPHITLAYVPLLPDGWQAPAIEPFSVQVDRIELTKTAGNSHQVLFKSSLIVDRRKSEDTAPSGNDGDDTDGITAIEELRQWKRKAKRHGAQKATDFICYVLPDGIQSYVRTTLAEIGTSNDDDASDAITSLFAEAVKLVDQLDDLPPIPGEYEAYWQDYDKLLADIGNDWLTDYMGTAWDTLSANIPQDPQTFGDVLASLHDTIVDTWTGTAENPGPLTAIVLAGIGAGNEALRVGASTAPSSKAVSLDIDWDLMSEQAVSFVQSYAFDLIRRIDQTTVEKVQAIFDNWLSSGGTVDELTALLEPVFNDAARAELIAQTESTRAYFEGSKKRWNDVGVNTGTWRTVQDARVCTTCRPLHGTSADLDAGWRGLKPPAHPGCRCYVVPDVGDL